jgi:hypothetical protein
MDRAVYAEKRPAAASPKWCMANLACFGFVEFILARHRVPWDEIKSVVREIRTLGSMSGEEKRDRTGNPRLSSILLAGRGLWRM